MTRASTTRTATPITDQVVACHQCGQVLLRVGTDRWDAGTCSCTWLPTAGAPPCTATITTAIGDRPCEKAPVGCCPFHDTPWR